jgi:hypothetical protein
MSANVREDLGVQRSSDRPVSRLDLVLELWNFKPFGRDFLIDLFVADFDSQAVGGAVRPEFFNCPLNRLYQRPAWFHFGALDDGLCYAGGRAVPGRSSALFRVPSRRVAFLATLLYQPVPPSTARWTGCPSRRVYAIPRRELATQQYGLRRSSLGHARADQLADMPVQLVYGVVKLVTMHTTHRKIRSKNVNDVSLLPLTSLD